MNTYPTFTYVPVQSSEEIIKDDLQIDRASNGAAKGRAFYTAPKLAFSVVHQGLTAEEKETLKTFYTDNRALPITFVWAGNGVTYTCIFAGPPKLTIESGVRWSATVMLEQV